ncbi:LANO_0G12310g1_1 [Lachancea nothofagi CBS 11611]|uniref:LANO_0G12310g1_1 n=1 Tax=Lachancea nothofagi CBS 11611 TaxID=1266666 RepID=A0A1G4KJT8_9SACH|nr:LANO_0G12310g1_1 [Lachancea nothofagi CBS 11611]
MSSNLDDYEDLDDLLEDPSKLDEEQVSGQGPIDETKKSISNGDPEMAGVIEDLQGEFAKLMQNNNGESQEDTKTAEDFKQLLNTLGEAASTSSGTTRKSEGLSANQGAKPGENGFKDIVSNTLDRLKESGTKVDTNLMEEKKKGNSDDILSQLLGQLVEGDGDEDEEGVENAIQSMLNQMSAKEVLYQPMKEMQTEFTTWMDVNEHLEEHADKIECYREQMGLVTKVVEVYEREDYEDGKFRNEVGQLLDQLEQLGDSPVSKGFSNPDTANLDKLLDIEGGDNLGNIDKDLQDTCQQQ